MARIILARVDLEPNDWKEAKSGGKGSWRCRALAVPGARFHGLRTTAGHQVDSNWYERRGHRIRWKGGSSPSAQLQVEVELRSPLRSRAVAIAMLVLGIFLGLTLSSSPELKTKLWSLSGAAKGQIAALYASIASSSSDARLDLGTVAKAD